MASWNDMQRNSTLSKISRQPARFKEAPPTLSHAALAGALNSMLGIGGDELGGSVMDPGVIEARAAYNAGQGAGHLGNLAAIVGPKQLAMLGAEAIHRGMMSGSPLLAAAAPMTVVKKEGGKWLGGSIPDAVSGLKKTAGARGLPVEQVLEEMNQVYTPEAMGRLSPESLAHVQRSIAELTPGVALNSWLEKRLQPYIQNEMATPSDPLRLAADAWPQKRLDLLTQAQAKVDAANAAFQRAKWNPEVAARIGSPLPIPDAMLTESRQAVLAAEKAKQLIELQGGLHFTPPGQDANILRGQAAQARNKAGFPIEGAGVTRLAQRWEDTADNLVTSSPMSTYQHFGASNITREHPWIQGLPPDQPMYRLNTSTSGYGDNFNEALGFSHLTDELANALNPQASGLPMSLALDPKQLNKLSVPQAAEHVAKINAWRAANKLEADQARANNSATHLIRDYTEHPELPGDYKWVQLKKGESDWKKMPDGWSRPSKNNPGFYETSKEDPTLKDLEDALKYEGDTMIHCVGGYCPSVAAGDTSIFSLRNTKTGQPHATIEVKPTPPPADILSQWANAAPNEIEGNLRRNLNNRWWAKVDDLSTEPSFADKLAHIKEHDPEFAKLFEGPMPLNINQVKGVKNAKPIDEVMPYVQDFIKNPHTGAPWGQVNDMHHTGLRRTGDVFNKAEIQTLKSKGIDLSPNSYLTPEEIAAHQQTFGTGAPAGERMSYDSHIDDWDIQLPPRAAPPEEFAQGGLAESHWSQHLPQPEKHWAHYLGD